MILNKHLKTIHIFELTCPDETNIDIRNIEKSNKYAHFITDINDYKCTVSCFEISTKGYVTKRNHTTLNTLHKYIKSDIKLSRFKQNISSLAIMASHFIFICRNEQAFQEPPYILPPIKN